MGEVFDSAIVIEMVSSPAGSPPARYRLFPECDPWPLPPSTHPVVTTAPTHGQSGRHQRAQINPDTRASITTHLNHNLPRLTETHPAFRSTTLSITPSNTPSSKARPKPNLTVKTPIMSRPSPLKSSTSTGLRSPARSRFAIDSTPSPSPTSSANTSPTSLYSEKSALFPAPPSGFRRRGDSKAAPSTAHMRGKAQRLEAEVLEKTSPKSKGGKKSGVPMSVGTLPAVSLAAVAHDRAGTNGKEVRVRRKPVGDRVAKEPSWHDLRLRPSSPTLVDTFRSFDDTPRSPPPTPIRNTHSGRQPKSRPASRNRLNEGRPSSRNKLRDEPRSAWDSDDDVMDEKEGLVGRVRGLSLGKRGSGASDGMGQKKGRGERKERKGSWMSGLLCGCSDDKGRKRHSLRW